MRWLCVAWGRFEAWMNVTVYGVRRVDVFLVIGFLFCTSYYWYVSGWEGAIIGALLYILIVMICVWLV